MKYYMYVRVSEKVHKISRVKVQKPSSEVCSTIRQSTPLDSYIFSFAKSGPNVTSSNYHPPLSNAT